MSSRGLNNHTMKRLLLSVCAVVLSVLTSPPAVCATSDAVDSCQAIKPLVRPMLLSVTYGRRFNTGGNENPDWFGRQRLTHSDLTFRLGVFVCRHWGIYGNLSFGGADNWIPPIGPKWQDELICGIPIPSAAASTGIMYRYEAGRWQWFARLGYGYISIGSASLINKPDMRTDDSSITNNIVGHSSWEASKSTGAAYADFGITAGFRTSRVVSIVLDVNYHLPVLNNVSYVTIKETQYFDYNKPTMENEWHFTSKSWGNNLTVSAGVQFQCELSGSRKKKK